MFLYMCATTEIKNQEYKTSKFAENWSNATKIDTPTKFTVLVFKRNDMFGAYLFVEFHL